MQGKSVLRVAIIVSCLAVTALGYQNSSGDNSDVVALASRTVCADASCNAILRQTSRSSFGQEFSFERQSAAGEKNAKSAAAAQQVFVECRRAMIFLGDWACNVKSSP